MPAFFVWNCITNRKYYIPVPDIKKVVLEKNKIFTNDFYLNVEIVKSLYAEYGIHKGEDF